MKALVVFYSRTGTTEKIAEEIAKRLKIDIERILDVKSRSGLLGWLRSGREAKKKMEAAIIPTRINPADYPCVIIGTPVWASSMSSPIRTYLSRNKAKFKKLAFFCTCGGSGTKALKEMEDLCGKPVLALLEVKTNEVKSGKYDDKIKEFISKLECWYD